MIVRPGALALCLGLASLVSAQEPPKSQPSIWSAKPDVAAFEKMEDDRLAAAQRDIDQLVSVTGPRTIANTLALYAQRAKHVADATGIHAHILLFAIAFQPRPSQRGRRSRRSNHPRSRGAGRTNEHACARDVIGRRTGTFHDLQGQHAGDLVLRPTFRRRPYRHRERQDRRENHRRDGNHRAHRVGRVTVPDPARLRYNRIRRRTPLLARTRHSTSVKIL